MQKSPRNIRLLLLFVTLIAVMQFSDPVSNIALSDALVFWSVRIVAVAGSLLLSEWLFARYVATRFNSPLWLKPAVLTIVVAAIPMTLAEVGLERSFPQDAAYDDSLLWAKSPVIAFIAEYLTILSVVLPINVLLWVFLARRDNISVTDAATHFVEPEFLAKSDGITLSDVIALEASEHYVRVWTHSREELIYARFGDAVAAMPESSGMQVHRSWWVANAAVKSAKRGERRYTLELSNGTTVPVSDKYAKEARRRGLLRR